MKSLLLFTVLSTITFGSELKFDDARIMFVPKGREVSAAFVNLKNDSKKDITIVSVDSKRFEKVELHTHKIIEGVMKMRPVESMIVKANSKRILKSKHDHVMFFGFIKELVEGETIKLTFNYSDKTKQTVGFKVKK